MHVTADLYGVYVDEFLQAALRCLPVPLSVYLYVPCWLLTQKQAVA